MAMFYEVSDVKLEIDKRFVRLMTQRMGSAAVKDVLSLLSTKPYGFFTEHSVC